MKWRLIEQEAYDAAMNMGIDHAIYESVAIGRENPTIRFYKWKAKSVSLGAYQNPKDISFEACKKNNVQITRRMTGGRAVFHDVNDLTYSVIAPIRVFNYSIDQAYRAVCYWIIDALTELGIDAELENKNDIVVKGRKISGNASRAMEKGVYLQHGTLVYDIDAKIMSAVLNIPKESIKAKVSSILQNKKVTQKEVYDKLKSSFVFSKDFKTESLSQYEIMRAKDLAEARYSNILLPPGSFMKSRGACYVERGA
ncbi:MAG: biotin/lipoate A/B protein ligase family protein [Nanoarchaeota archaeon]